jgi:hypothetical protein
MPAKSLSKSKLAYGLSWYPLTTENLKSESQALAKSEGKKLGSLYTNPSGDNHQVGLTRDQKMAGGYPSAALFGQLVDDGIILESFGKNKYWLCLAVGGQVIIGYDVIITSEEVKRKITEFFEGQASISDLPEEFRIISDEASIELLRDCLGEEPEINSIAELVSSSGLSFPGDFSRLKIKPVAGNNVSIIAGVAVVLGVSGYVLYGGSSPKPTEDIDMSGLASMIQPTEDAKKPEVIDHKKVKEEAMKVAVAIAIAEEKEHLFDTYNKTSAYNVINSVSEHIESLPLVKNGWRLFSAIYTSSGDSSPYVSWVSTSGSPVDFKDNFGASENIDFSGKSGRVSFSVPEAVSKSSSVDFFSEIDGSSKSVHELMTELNKHSVVWEMGPLEVGARYETSKDIEAIDRDKAKSPNLSYSLSTIRVTGNSIHTLKKIASVLESNKVVLAKTLKIEFNGTIAWEFKGIFYEF